MFHKLKLSDQIRRCEDENGNTIAFQLNDMGTSYQCYTTNSSYLGRVVTRKDFDVDDSVEIRPLVQPMKWIEFKALDMPKETADALTGAYACTGTGVKPVNAFKEKHDFWYTKRETQVVMKVRIRKILEGAMFAFQTVSLPTPGGGHVSVNLAHHVLPLQFSRAASGGSGKRKRSHSHR